MNLTRTIARAGALCAALALTIAPAAAPALADTPQGKRLGSKEINGLVPGKTLEAVGNVMVAFPWQTWIHPNSDGTFKMVTAVEWIELLKNEPAKIHKLDENGKWWVEGDRLCLKFLHRASGAQDCFDVYENQGEVRLQYAQCTLVSTDRCQTGRIAYTGKFVTGDTVPVPDPTN